MKDYLKKRKSVLVFAVLLMSITFIPYLLGYALEGNEWRFTGFIIGVEDGNSYIAKMLSGTNGAWFFQTPYTSQPQRGLIAFLPYLLLGKIAGGEAIHEQLVVLYHLFRFAAGVLVFLAAYDFVSLFLSTEKWRRWAVVIFGLGGGLGWLLAVFEMKDFLGSLPLDFVSPESFGFLGLFGIPHLAAARAVFLWSLSLYIAKKPAYLTGLLLVLLGLLQPIYVLVAWAVIGTHTILQVIICWLIKPSQQQDKFKDVIIDVRNAILAVIISSPLIIYTTVSFLTDPVLSNWNKQNILKSPHPIHYVVAYGLYVPFLIPGLRKIVRSDQRKGMLLIGWLIILPFLIYAPVSIQRRLSEGVWIAFSVGFISYYEDRKKITGVEKSLLIFPFFTTLIIFLGTLLSVQRQSLPIFRPVDEVNMYKFIADHVEAQSVILSSYDIGNNLPAWAPVKVVLGHGPETVNNKTVKKDVEQFYDIEGANATRMETLRKYQVDFVVLGPPEKPADIRQITTGKCLQEIYNKNHYLVYQVLNCQ